MLAKASFFAENVQPSASENIFCAICFGVNCRVAGLALADEPGVFGEPAGIQIERNPVARGHRLHRFDVRHRDRLAAAGVVGDGEHDQRNLLRAFGCDQPLQRRHVHVALEIQARLRVGASGMGRSTARAPVNSMLARVVSKCVLFGTTWPGRHSTVNRMRSAARPWCVGIMCRNPVSSSTTRFMRKKLSLPGVGFVAAHHGGPLLGGHGAGAGIGQQVDQDVRALDEKQVVAGLAAGTVRAPRAWCGAAARRS